MKDYYNIKYTTVRDGAPAPSICTPFSAGSDLHAYIDEVDFVDVKGNGGVKVAPGETRKINTGIAIELPTGFFGAIFARSGLATKHGIRPANCVGVIDSDYRGEIIVAIHNDSKEDFIIYDGDRIAQLVIIPYVTPTFIYAPGLSDTERSDGGFGSTGK